MAMHYAKKVNRGEKIKLICNWTYAHKTYLQDNKRLSISSAQTKVDKKSTERNFESLLGILALMPFHPKENGGFFGKGNGTLSFVNIDNTINM